RATGDPERIEARRAVVERRAAQPGPATLEVDRLPGLGSGRRTAGRDPAALARAGEPGAPGAIEQPFAPRGLAARTVARCIVPVIPASWRRPAAGCCRRVRSNA